MALTPQTHVRVVRGAHAGRDGKILTITHGVCEVESWLDREEILICLEADVVPLADAPRCAHCVEREKRLDSLAAENGRLRRELDVARLAASLQSDDGGESGTITTNARVVRRHCVPVAGGHVVVEVPRRKP